MFGSQEVFVLVSFGTVVSHVSFLFWGGHPSSITGIQCWPQAEKGDREADLEKVAFRIMILKKLLRTSHKSVTDIFFLF